jgi:ribose transport system permease protein
MSETKTQASSTSVDDQPAATPSPDEERGPRSASRVGLLVAERFGLVGVWAIVFVVFAILRPTDFLSNANLANIFGSQAVLLVLTLGVMIPLTAGDYDLSSGSTLPLAAMLVAILNVNDRMPIVPAALLCIAMGAVIGLVNGALIVKLGNDSFIITLGMATILGGIDYWISNSNTIIGVSVGLSNIVFNDTLFGIPLEFYFGVALTLILWYVWSYTPLGQRVLLVGSARRVAELSGLNTPRLRVGALVASGMLSALAGVMYTGTTGSASPTAGADFLLPAFAAVFLGSTCIRPGRFNPLGTFVAVYFLATGIVGLELLGASSAIQDVFYGAALVIAVSISRFVHRTVS